MHSSCDNMEKGMGQDAIEYLKDVDTMKGFFEKKQEERSRIEISKISRPLDVILAKTDFAIVMGMTGTDMYNQRIQTLAHPYGGSIGYVIEKV